MSLEEGLTEVAKTEEEWIITYCCIHQGRQRTNPFSRREGYGNCTLCTYDPKDNPNCRGYQPIEILIPKRETPTKKDTKDL